MLSRENPSFRKHNISTAAEVWGIALVEAELYWSKSILSLEVLDRVEKNDWYSWQCSQEFWDRKKWPDSRNQRAKDRDWLTENGKWIFESIQPRQWSQNWRIGSHLHRGNREIKIVATKYSRLINDLGWIFAAAAPISSKFIEYWEHGAEREGIRECVYLERSKF